MTSLVTEWRTAIERYNNASGHTDAENDQQCDTEARLALAVARTPARIGAEMKLKLEMLLDLMGGEVGDWVDERDRILAESLKADFDRLN